MSKKPVKKAPLKVIHNEEFEPPMIVTQQHQMIQSSADNLIATAISKGTDLEQLKQLIEMRNQELARVAEIEFNRDMAKFQSLLPSMFKNKAVGFEHKSGPGKTEYKYQELGDIEKNIQSAKAQCGISTTWTQKEEGDFIYVSLVISHIGGHTKIGNPLKGLRDNSNKNSLQALGSTLTYLQRYTLKAGLGLSSIDPDDDGQLGGGKPQKSSVVDLIVLSDSQFKSAMQQVGNGTRTVDDLLLVASLSTQQEQALRKVEESRQTQKA